MTAEKPEDFYRFYADFKRYTPPAIKEKHRKWYDREFWIPTASTIDTAILELGSGPGEFLLYLHHKGVKRFRGVEMNHEAVAVVPDEVKPFVHVVDIWDYLDAVSPGEKWDRIVMLDVLEHFSPAEGVVLLERLSSILAPSGLIVVRVPNMASPWGPNYQFSDVTHKAQYSAGSLHQVGLAAGFEVVEFLPQRRGPPFRRFCEDILHGLLNRILTVPPVIWTANIIAVYRRSRAVPPGS